MLRSDERLSRFIFQRNQFHVAQNAVGHRAFLPPGNNKLSVFGTNRLSENSTWIIGRRVATVCKQNFHARADLSRDELGKHRLQLIRDEPPRRHRNIVSWPAHNQKDDIKLIAVELAAAATLRLPLC
jgi:hypothetical protein